MDMNNFKNIGMYFDCTVFFQPLYVHIVG